MARLRAVIKIFLLAIAALSEATLHLGEPAIRPQARSTNHRSSSTQLLKPDHAVKRGVSIPLEITKSDRRVGSEGLQPLGRSALGSTSTELGLSHRNLSSYPTTSHSPRSQPGLNPTSPLNMTLQTFTAILDPTLQAISEHINFWFKIIEAAANYYASFTPVQDFEIVYGRFKLRLTTKKGDTIDWIILKGIAQVVLEYARAGFYGWYYIICYIGPLTIAITLGFRPRNPHSIVQWIG